MEFDLQLTLRSSSMFWQIEAVQNSQALMGFQLFVLISIILRSFAYTATIINENVRADLIFAVKLET